MIIMRRPVGGHGRHTYAQHQFHSGAASGARPLPGGAPVITGPLPVPGEAVYSGMDPSDPLTYVRPWNPAPGMIGYLNYDGAQTQARQPTGGLQRGKQQRRKGYRR